MSEHIPSIIDNPIIKVIGVGGGGGNAIKHMIENSLSGVEFVCVNTDSQALLNNPAKNKMQIGIDITKGLGAGADPQVGTLAAQENQHELTEMLQGSDMVFITAGMGGGTGTGAASVIAEISRRLGILTVGVITKPFPFEGARRMKLAEYGISELSKHVDSLIIIPNDKLLKTLDKKTSLLDAFKAANEVLNSAVRGISNLITSPGLINVDFADVRTVMANRGITMMGTSTTYGVNRAVEAAKAATSSQLLENIDFSQAKGVLVNITSGMDMTIGEFEEVGRVISDLTSEDASVIVGTVIDMEMQDAMSVTVVVTSDRDQYIVDYTDKNEGNLAKRSKSVSKNNIKSKNSKCLLLDSALSGLIKSNTSGGPNIKNRLNLEADYIDVPSFLLNKVH